MKTLQSGQHKAVVENIRWVTEVPECKDIPGEPSMIDQCNLVFKVLSGSDAGILPLSQWRKVVEMIATNPELRVLVRRTDAVRACYGDASGHAENGLNRKNFKLMLIKTADLMGIHPCVLFQELASQAEELAACQKMKSESPSPYAHY